MSTLPALFHRPLLCLGPTRTRPPSAMRLALLVAALVATLIAISVLLAAQHHSANDHEASPRVAPADDDGTGESLSANLVGAFFSERAERIFGTAQQNLAPLVDKLGFDADTAARHCPSINAKATAINTNTAENLKTAVDVSSSYSLRDFFGGCTGSACTGVPVGIAHSGGGWKALAQVGAQRAARDTHAAPATARNLVQLPPVPRRAVQRACARLRAIARACATPTTPDLARAAHAHACGVRSPPPRPHAAHGRGSWHHRPKACSTRGHRGQQWWHMVRGAPRLLVALLRGRTEPNRRKREQLHRQGVYGLHGSIRDAPRARRRCQSHMGGERAFQDRNRAARRA